MIIRDYKRNIIEIIHQINYFEGLTKDYASKMNTTKMKVTYGDDRTNDVKRASHHDHESQIIMW